MDFRVQSPCKLGGRRWMPGDILQDLPEEAAALLLASGAIVPADRADATQTAGASASGAGVSAPASGRGKKGKAAG